MTDDTTRYKAVSLVNIQRMNRIIDEYEKLVVKYDQLQQVNIELKARIEQNIHQAKALEQATREKTFCSSASVPWRTR